MGRLLRFDGMMAGAKFSPIYEGKLLQAAKDESGSKVHLPAETYREHKAEATVEQIKEM